MFLYNEANKGGEYTMAEVKVGENESIESALRRFKKKIQKAGILSEVKKRERYEKPSVKRKRKSEAARKRKVQNKEKPVQNEQVFLLKINYVVIGPRLTLSLANKLQIEIPAAAKPPILPNLAIALKLNLGLINGIKLLNPQRAV